MDSQNLDTYYAELISTYLSGNASEAQIAELEAWVLADPENKKHFVAFKKAWMLTALTKENQQTVSVEEAWQKTAEEVFSEAKVRALKPSVSSRTWWSVAAAIIVLMMISFWFLKNVWEEPAQMLATNETSQTFELTDGSVVNLNSTSSIRYSQEKESGARRVHLEGDAFFDVKRDEQHPFIIQTQGVEIEVLGTAFYVDSRKEQPEVQVIVESGSVSVTAGGSSEILAANEKAVFVKENQELMKVINQDPNFTSLKTNVLKFDSTRMEEVVFALNRQFRANISLENESQKECLLNGTYSNLPLDSILIYIDAYGLKPVRKASGIVLTGNCE